MNGAMSWAKADPKDAEWNAFVAENASGEGPLLFGRITYELMTSYWPTALASKHDPVVAERMKSKLGDKIRRERFDLDGQARFVSTQGH
jgi:dihydrofolate reductase